jgi:hypothetical protein
MFCFFLVLQAQQSNVEIKHDGCLSVSTSYFERNTIVNLQKELESENTSNREIGFWVGLDPEGEWESIRSLLPLSVAPKSLQIYWYGSCDEKWEEACNFEGSCRSSE